MTQSRACCSVARPVPQTRTGRRTCTRVRTGRMSSRANRAKGTGSPSRGSSRLSEGKGASQLMEFLLPSPQPVSESIVTGLRQGGRTPSGASKARHHPLFRSQLPQDSMGTKNSFAPNPNLAEPTRSTRCERVATGGRKVRPAIRPRERTPPKLDEPRSIRPRPTCHQEGGPRVDSREGGRRKGISPF